MVFDYHIPSIRQFVENLGDEILALRSRGVLQVETKEDGSKVTQGDYLSHNRLTDFLSRHYSYPCISEEQDNPPSFPMGTQWVLDPIDGTSHYLKGEDDFSIMLALAHDREPMMSLIYQPAYQFGYYSEVGKGSYRFTKGGEMEAIKVDNHTPLHERSFQLSSIRNYIGEYNWFHEKNIRNHQIRGGIGMKLGAIAEGIAHYYLNFDRPLKVWDVFPSLLLAREAGALVTNAQNGIVAYNESGYALSEGLFVAPDRKLLPFEEIIPHVH